MKGLEYLQNRLNAIKEVLSGAHAATRMSCNSVKGSDRESFIKETIIKCFPGMICQGGEIVDKSGNLSGQLDLVLQFPFMPSFSSVLSEGNRLYLAETVAAVIEVKSNLKTQWKQIERQSNVVSKLLVDSEIGPMFRIKTFESLKRIPFFIISYEGYEDFEQVYDKVKNCKNIQAIFTIDASMCAWCKDGKWYSVKEEFSIAFLLFLSHIQASIAGMLPNSGLLGNYINQMGTMQVKEHC